MTFEQGGCTMFWICFDCGTPAGTDKVTRCGRCGRTDSLGQTDKLFDDQTESGAYALYRSQRRRLDVSPGFLRATGNVFRLCVVEGAASEEPASQSLPLDDGAVQVKPVRGSHSVAAALRLASSALGVAVGLMVAFLAGALG